MPSRNLSEWGSIALVTFLWAVAALVAYMGNLLICVPASGVALLVTIREGVSRGIGDARERTGR